MPSRRSSSSTSGVAEAAVVSSAPAPPPSAYHSRSSVDRSAGNQPPSSSSSSTTISSAASSSSPAGVSQSQTLPRKFGKLLQLGTTTTPSDRNRADVDQPATAAVDGSFGLSRIVGLGGRGTTGDGPWRISCSNGATQGKLVLYASTSTHNYTLLRTVREVNEMHAKLVPMLPPSALPTFPSGSMATYSQTTVKAQGPSRRRSFLNAFSRFTSDAVPRGSSPGHGLVSPPVSPTSSSPVEGLPSFGAGGTVLGSPLKETGNPIDLVAGASSGTKAGLESVSSGKLDDGAPSQMSALSAYLTEVANDERVRETKVWKKLIRVRADDLSSVRVERKLKRTQSAQALNLRSPFGPRSQGQVKGAGGPASPTEDALSADGVIIEMFEELDDGELARTPDGSLLATTTAGLSTRPIPSSPNEKVKDKRSALERSSSSSRKLFKKNSPAASPLAKTVDLPPTPDATPSKPLPSPDTSLLSTPTKKASTPEVSDPEGDDGESPLPKSKQQAPRPASADPDKNSARRTMKDRSIWDGSSGDNEAVGKKAAGGRKRREKKKVSIEEFELIRVLGRGCAGKVLLVRMKTSSSSPSTLMAMKCIVKRHVVAHQEIGHTLTEQAVLKRMSREIQNPFIVHLHHSFHDKENLFLVMDFHPGGDLATQLARWGKFGRDRARFYAAEIVEGVQGLHAAGVIYRDLKPENILLDQSGHLILTDFGLSKEFPRSTITSLNAEEGDADAEAVTPTYMQQSGTPMTEQERRDWAPAGGMGRDTTTTFCGTAEYLAPEVIQGLPYSYPVDWWALGTMLYEMLIGITPFYASNHTDMYTRVLHDELIFPDERPVDQDTKSLIRGLLQRNPALRLSEPRIKKHPYFSMIDWDHVYHKRYIPPYTPPTDPLDETDTQNFDSAFLDMVPSVNGEGETGEGLASAPSAATAAAAAEANDDRASLFDGYSYRERDAASILLEEDEPQSPVDRVSGDYGRSSFDNYGAHSRSPTADSRASIDALTSDATSPTAPISPMNESSSTVNEDSVSLTAPSTAADDSSTSEAIDSADAIEDAPPRISSQRHRRQRSGIPALDRGLPSDIDADDDDDEEEDDWDLVEKPRDGRGESNGARGTTLFARGVVDRYRLGVLKKKESRASGLNSGMSTPRTFSAATMSTSNSSATIDGSVSPESKVRRGLTFKSSKFKIRPKAQTSQSYTGESKSASHPPVSHTSSASQPGPTSPVAPSMAPSYSLPANLATNGHGRAMASEHSAASSVPDRSSSSSPTKGTRLLSGDDSDPAGTTSSSRLKKMGKQGTEKMMSLFGGPKSSSTSSSTANTPAPHPSP